jgi:hypothetical protein
MADDALLKAPDFALIEDEAGQGTASAVRSLWLSLLDRTARIERQFQRATSEISFGDLIAPGEGITGGIRFNPDATGTANDEEWWLAVGADGYDAFFGLYNATAGAWAWKTYRTGSTFRFAPPTSHVGTNQLGDISSLRWDAVYAHDFFRIGYLPGQGTWTDVPYSSGNFTASSGAWTVDSGDQITFAYTIVGETMHLKYYFATTSISATPVALIIPIPDGYQAANRRVVNTFFAVDAGVRYVGVAEVLANGTVVSFYKLDGSTWSVSTDTAYVIGELTIPIVI